MKRMLKSLIVLSFLLMATACSSSSSASVKEDSNTSKTEDETKEIQELVSEDVAEETENIKQSDVLVLGKWVRM